MVGVRLEVLSSVLTLSALLLLLLLDVVPVHVVRLLHQAN